MPGPAGRLRGFLQQAGAGVGQPPHLARRPGVETVGLRVGARGHGLPRRQQGRGRGAVRAIGQLPVQGQQGRVRLRPGGQRVGDAAMQAAALPGQQLAVEHLPDQVMRERVAIGSGGQQPPGDRLAGRGQQIILTERDGRGQQLMRHPAVGHAHLVDHGPRRRRDPGGLGQHGFGDRRWGHPGARARELERVQRVAFGGADHGGDRVWPGAFRDLVSDQLGDFVRGQAGQPQPRHPRAPLQVGEPPPGLAGQFLIPQRGDHQDRQVAQPDRQEGQQFMGGLIGPVQVLQDEDQRRLGGQVAEQREYPFEETVPGREHVAGFIVSRAAMRPALPARPRKGRKPARPRPAARIRRFGPGRRAPPI